MSDLRLMTVLNDDEARAAEELGIQLYHREDGTPMMLLNDHTAHCVEIYAAVRRYRHEDAVTARQLLAQLDDPST
ncbi:hypothetical protein EF910_31965 [Streptomyces sp. WAC07149]|uniref:hypothetical protein n=1 Tax=Streptomyces sp. WAC07149 TaxID=2487425 RepID=UPI000F7A2145|nr:hypothetical protein [Streptomyces sp. WAC07149]RST00354.1 hypothetical protein EF910_31965 [Streptomyces sp. WAC07149]